MAGGLAEKQDLGKAESQATVINAVTTNGPTSTHESEEQLEYVPDGGREAWTVVLGSSLALFASAGMINAFVCSVSPPLDPALSLTR